MIAWGPDRSVELAALVAAAMPGEDLAADVLGRCCWADPDPAVVLADPAGRGAVSAVLRRTAGVALGYVRLIVVDPAARRAGLGRALLDAAHTWLVEQGAIEVHAGGSAPFYLWPGIDVRSTGGLCLFEAAGYVCTGAALNLRCPTGFRAPVPPGCRVGRVGEAVDPAGVRRWCADAFPHWVPELQRAIELGGAHAGVRDDGAVVGFACHGANRPGWFGPTGTDPSWRGRGLGSALLAACCQDAAAAGRDHLEIAWIGPVRFYAKAGAEVSRVFTTAVWRPAPA
ncbi:MAG: GNAT family N-acetyltransferase [Acidimicrobiales bacterium]|nr:GNAT family N-acetyltransferase [Acidimicrobiales bacterium]